MGKCGEQATALQLCRHPLHSGDFLVVVLVIIFKFMTFVWVLHNTAYRDLQLTLWTFLSFWVICFKALAEVRI
jgi:hypothetical protein